MDIFEISKKFPPEEKYSLTGQIRKCSRSVCANLGVSDRRSYPAHFASKLADSDAENGETKVWLDFSHACKYISSEEYSILEKDRKEVGNLLGDMIKNPEKYI